MRNAYLAAALLCNGVALAAAIAGMRDPTIAFGIASFTAAALAFFARS